MYIKGREWRVEELVVDFAIENLEMKYEKVIPLNAEAQAVAR